MNVRHPGLTPDDVAAGRSLVLTDAAQGQWLSPTVARLAIYVWSDDWEAELRSLLPYHGPDRAGAKRLLEAIDRRRRRPGPNDSGQSRCERNPRVRHSQPTFVWAKRPPRRPSRFNHVLPPDTPNGIRTRAAGVKGRSPRPLDDGGRRPGGYPRRVPEIRVATARRRRAGVRAARRAQPRRRRASPRCRKHVVLGEIRRSVDDRFVAEENGRVVGYAHVRPSRDVVVAAGDAAIGDALLACVEDRARARGHRRRSRRRWSQDEPFHALVQRRGFVHERVILRMWRMLDEDDRRTGVGRRRGPSVPYVDRDGHSGEDAARRRVPPGTRSYVPQPYDEWHTFMTDHDEFDPSLWFLVERDDELVACALHWKEHDGRGWVKDIAVRESARGRRSRQGAAPPRAARVRGARRRSGRSEGRRGQPHRCAGLYAREGFVVDQALRECGARRCDDAGDRLAPPLAATAAARAVAAARAARGRDRERRPRRSAPNRHATCRSATRSVVMWSGCSTNGSASGRR